VLWRLALDGEPPRPVRRHHPAQPDHRARTARGPAPTRRAQTTARGHARTLAGDKNDHQKELVRGCRERGLAPHVACKKNLQIPGLNARTTTGRGYQTSQRVRKRIEELFGWMKTLGGLRRSRSLGWERTQALGLLRGGHLQPSAHGATANGCGRLKERPRATAPKNKVHESSPSNPPQRLTSSTAQSWKTA